MELNEHGVPMFREHPKFTVSGDTSSVGKRQETDGEKGFSCQTKEFELDLAGKGSQQKFSSPGQHHQICVLE